MNHGFWAYDVRNEFGITVARVCNVTGRPPKNRFRRILVDETPVKIMVIEGEPHLGFLEYHKITCQWSQVSVFLEKIGQWAYFGGQSAVDGREFWRYYDNPRWKREGETWYKLCTTCNQWKTELDYYKQRTSGRLDETRDKCKDCFLEARHE